ncbi:hypothetical protein FIBSPDRAFT_1048636 [Athelia psychrophila]|uniref:Uncharacterized protein n=1 Tax=Athelia psychrophila TaxID=1759441 RepID=A0A166DEQ0_9AGAM|nr:hypothetical protein FIBSPDRAFT_1048636 [Fibularhizoctonia sp. CBS 109695]
MASNCTCQTERLAKPLGSLQPPMADIIGPFGSPSPAECATVRENILQIAADMSELDSEIGRLEKILERLRRNRVALQKHSDGHQNLLNLTRHLPVEILGVIFIQLQDMLGGRSIAPTRVCRHWREAAIGTSRLWSHINIQYRTWRALEDTEMTSIWLQRSGGHPLNIILGRMDPEKFPGTEKENPALDALLHNQAHRWNDVKLIVTKSMLSFLKNIPMCLPMLHTLHIDGPENDLGIMSLNNFRYASALRVLTLKKRVSLLSSQRLPELPWAQLTAFTLVMRGEPGRRYTSHDACIALKEAVNLTSCTMAIKASSSFAKKPPSSILLLNLIYLDITAVNGENVQDIINVLELPALTELNILNSVQSTATTVPEFVAALITRSDCQLLRLSLGTHGVPFNHDGLLELLKLTPMLSGLKLQFGGSVGVDDSLMDLLTHKPDHAAGLCCLLPKLASVRLTVHRAFSYERFLNLLSSRHRVAACNAGVGLAQLREAALIAWADVTASGRRARHLPRETFEGFRELRESGLDLYVIDGGTRRSLEEYFAPGDVKDDLVRGRGRGPGW